MVTTTTPSQPYATEDVPFALLRSGDMLSYWSGPAYLRITEVTVAERSVTYSGVDVAGHVITETAPRYAGRGTRFPQSTTILAR